MFCPKCGKDLPDNSKFCKYCGSQIKNKGTLSHVPASAGDDEKSKNIICRFSCIDSCFDCCFCSYRYWNVQWF